MRFTVTIILSLMSLQALAASRVATLSGCEQALGAPSRQIKVKWTKLSVKKGLMALGEAGFELSSKNLKTLTDPLALEVLENTLGFKARPRVLMEEATELFGTLQSALWEKPMVIRALKDLNNAGYRPNSSFFKTGNSTPEILAIVHKAIGFPCDLYTVFSQANRLFGSFKQALASAGLEGLYHARAPQPWDKDLVHRSLRVLHQAGYKPKSHFVQNSQDERAQKIVSQEVGFDTTLATLHIKAKELHGGNFTRALEEAGLPVEEIQTVNKRAPWTKELVHKALRALFEAGFVPNAMFLQKSKDAKAAKVLIATVQFETALSSVYNKAIEFHDGNFQEAIVESGLPVEAVVGKYSNQYWTDEAVYRGLRALYDNGYPPTATFLRDEKSAFAEKIVTAAMGFPSTLSGLYEEARERHRGVYQEALNKAGLPLEEFLFRFESQPMTPEMIPKGLRALLSYKIFPTSRVLRSGRARPTKIISEALGFPVTLRRFYEFLRQTYPGGLSEALRDSGVPVDQFVKSWTQERIVQALKLLDARPQPAKDQVIRVLRELYENGVIYNARSAEKGSAQLARKISKLFGYHVDARFLYDQATQEFGSYRKALLAADLPADEIIVYRNRDIDLLATLPTHQERIVENGEIRYQTYIGEAPSTPEEDLLRKELESSIVDSLPDEYKLVGEKILDVILSTQGDDIEISTIFKGLADLGVTIADAQKVFGLLRDNEELRELLTGN